MQQHEMRRTNAEWVRKFIYEHPEATVDDVARAANNTRHGVNRGVVADIRREVLAVLAKGVTDKPASAIPGLVVRPTPPSFNPPKLVASVVPAPATAPLPPAVAEPQKDPGNGEERRRFVDDYCLANPLALSGDVHAALHARFGGSISTNYITDALRTIRSTTGIIPKGARVGRRFTESLPPPPPHALAPPTPVRPSNIDAAIADAARALKAAMQAGRIRKLVMSVEDLDGKFDVDWTSELHLASKGKVTV